MSTFKMRVGPAKTDVKDVEILDQFTMFGEEWVVHVPNNDGPVFRVSHKETGYGVPRSGSDTKEGARKLAELVLATNRENIQAVIDQARR